MDRRAPPPLGGGASLRRPPAPQRAVSGGSYGGSYQLPKRPTLPSGLSNVRSASQPVNVVDLTTEMSGKDRMAAFLENKEKMVSSPDIINVDNDDEEDKPPAKRMKMEGDEFRAGSEELIGQETDMADQVMPGEPLPGLEKLNRVMRNGRAQRRHRYTVDPAVRKAHGTDAPILATRAPAPKKVLDFSPWSGSHPEDVLTDTVVKSGYSDGVKNNGPNECGSAKATIWPSLSQKNHQGLAVLGGLFATVIERRQLIGRCTAPSTFKPPPRVTVTDTKREAWLRDLANSEVPLRKQSRTIPHGIRGKLLMEQCLSKAVPLQRAVWLAKCVGANELRAFRRKGVNNSTAASGEAKWVREWTGQVEQFLESVIGACGQKNWQQKTNYAVKLATAFFAEKLLDMDHYLGWIVSSFAEATLERLPIWIVMAQLYWKPILAYSRRGKTLAEGMLEHLRKVTQAGVDSNDMLKRRLQKLVAVIAVSNRGCLIIPRVWEKYKDLLCPQTSTEAAMKSPASDIVRRNERLAAPLRTSAGTSSSPLLAVYRELDQPGLEIDIDELAATCLTLIPDSSKLVSACLEWSSTLYRTGTARVYLAARLIAQLHASGHDTDSAILHYLGEVKDVSPSTTHSLRMVVVDLVRLEAFSVGRYLQWLISSGLAMPTDEASLASGLLTAIPTSGLPLHLLNTRKTLLTRLGVSIDEDSLVEKTFSQFENSVDTPTEHLANVHLPEELTLCAKLSLAKRISTKLDLAAKDGHLTLDAFIMARKTVEHVGDLATMGDLVSAASTSDMPALLATVCDTVNHHAEVFAAQGRFVPLVQSLVEQYTILRSQQPLDRSFIVALIGLVSRIPARATFTKLLNEDLAICEQQTSLMVCSPASDSLIGMQATSLASENDIDAVFASGNTMDEQLMQRVFLRIMEYTSKLPPHSSQPVSRVCGWLTQLRLVDGSEAFDRIVQNYVRALLKSGDGKTFTGQTMDSLVASGSLQLSTVASIAKEVATPSFAATVLRVLLSSETANHMLSECEQYRLLLHKQRCKDENAVPLSALFRLAAETPDLDVQNPELLHFIIRCSSAKSGSVRCFFDSGKLSAVVQANAGRIVTAVMRLGGRELQLSPKLDLRPLVCMAGPLSVRFCVEAIRWMQSNTNWTFEDDDTLKDALLDCFGRHSEVWPQLLEVASDKVKLALHEWAQEEVLSMAYKDGSDSDGTTAGQLQRFLNLLAVTSQAAMKIDGTAFIDKIAGKLKDLESSLAEIRSLETGRKEAFASATQRLHTILHLCVLHVHDIVEESDASKQARCNLLAALCSLLVSPALQMAIDLIEYLFDLALTLANNILEDSSAAQRVPAIAKLPPSTLLTFILGRTSSLTDPWLAIAFQPNPPAVSQQQRALSRHPSSQHLQAKMSNRMPAQQSPTQQPQMHGRWPSHGGPSSGLMRPDGRMLGEVKVTPFALRRWEIMPDPTPVMGENDTSLSLSLFGARKV